MKIKLYTDNMPRFAGSGLATRSDPNFRLAQLGYLDLVMNLLRLLQCRRLLFTTMSQAYATEEQVAVAAVRRACHLTSSVFNKLVKNETLTKDDKSPVTGAFAVVHAED